MLAIYGREYCVPLQWPKIKSNHVSFVQVAACTLLRVLSIVRMQVLAQATVNA